MNLAEGLHGTEGSNDFKSDNSNTVTDDNHTGIDANAKEVEIMSTLLLDQLNERDELVNAIQLKNRFISFVHRVEEVSKSSREGRINTIRGILKSLHVPVPATLSPHPSTLVIPYIPGEIPSDEQLEALCRCLEAMASNSRLAPTLLAKYICSVYLE